MENENKRTNNIALIVILILILIILGLVGYIVYDKVLKPTETTEPTPAVENTEVEETPGITEDEEYFNELLSTFLAHSNSYMKNIDSFSDEEITTYLYFYYSDYANKNQVSIPESNGRLTYNVSKEELDNLVLKTFGKEEYNIESIGRDGIKKIDENTYQVYWNATGWFIATSQLSEITKTNDGIIITYTLTGNETFGNNGKVIGTQKFHLVKNEDDYNVTKIEYIENK